MNDGTGPGQDDQARPDPTAPSWATPEVTQQIPTEPTPSVPVEPPIAPPTPYAPRSSAPEPAAPPAPYGQAPYGQAPYGQAPYGQASADPTAYGRPGYGQSPYGPSPYGSPFTPYGQQAYAAPQQSSSALVLTILSAVGCLLCCLWFAPSLVFGIVALSRQSSDPASSARITRYGWVSVGVMALLGVLLGVALFAWAVHTGVESTPQVDYGI